MDLEEGGRGARGLFLSKGQQTMGSCLLNPHWEASSLPRAFLSPIFTWTSRLRSSGQEERETQVETVEQLLPPSATENAKLGHARLVRIRRKEKGDIFSPKRKESLKPFSTL